MTHHEAIDKAVKLLRLAQSSNPHEAALAASRAQEIMDRHKLEGLSADYDTDALNRKPDEPIRDFKADLMDPGTQSETWKARLASTVADVNECKVYLNRTRATWDSKPKVGFAIVGRASDAQTVRYIYGWIVREIERLTEEHCVGYGRTFFNNFRIGCVESVCVRLKLARKETEVTMTKEAVATNNSMALVRVNNAIAKRNEQVFEVERWVKNNLKLRSGGRAYTTLDPTARELGRKAGASISIQPRQQLV